MIGKGNLDFQDPSRFLHNLVGKLRAIYPMNAIESKVVVIGPPSKPFGAPYYLDVGKTCLAIRYVRDRFVENSTATIGASFLMKTVTSGNTPITMKIWDTAGQEVFRSMSSLYYKNVDGGTSLHTSFDL